MHHLQGQAKHVLIVRPHQCLERFGVALLGAADQRQLIRPTQFRIFWYVSG
jgi:hypothetical protein